MVGELTIAPLVHAVAHPWTRERIELHRGVPVEAAIGRARDEQRHATLRSGGGSVLVAVAGEVGTAIGPEGDRWVAGEVVDAVAQVGGTAVVPGGDAAD